MTTKHILNLLIVLISIQISLTKPLDNNTKAQHTNEISTTGTKYKKLEAVDIGAQFDDESTLTPKDQLLLLALNGLQDVSLVYVNKASEISANLLKDPEFTAVNTPKTQEFKRNITLFNEHFDSCKDIDNLFDLVEFYSNTTSYYYEIPSGNLNSDTNLMLKLLRKHGSEKLDNDFEKLFNVFMEKFKRKFEEVRKQLTADTALVEWFDKFKAIKDFDEKINALETFFAFYV